MIGDVGELCNLSTGSEPDKYWNLLKWRKYSKIYIFYQIWNIWGYIDNSEAANTIANSNVSLKQATTELSCWFYVQLQLHMTLSIHLVIQGGITNTYSIAPPMIAH
jgi:hypothetical protein